MKCRFDIYDEDDIKQEIYFLMLKAEEVCDLDKGDEYTFYLNYCYKRLLILRRDKYSVNEQKKGIADACSLDIDVEQTIAGYLEEYKDLIDAQIAANVRADYLRFREGVKIPHRNKQIIIEHIKDIVGRAKRNEEHGD